MGDRVNFVFSTKSVEGKTDEQCLEGSLVLYSHWGGSHAANDLAHAMEKARPRWHDEAYCLRILVSQIVGTQWDEETGFGLSVGEICDNEYPYLIVDLERGRVRANDFELTFDEYLALPQRRQTQFHQGKEAD